MLLYDHTEDAYFPISGLNPVEPPLEPPSSTGAEDHNKVSVPLLEEHSPIQLRLRINPPKRLPYYILGKTELIPPYPKTEPHARPHCHPLGRGGILICPLTLLGGSWQ